MNINDALYHAVHDYPGGVAALAARMVLAPSTLYSMANPNESSHPWPLPRVLQVMSFTGDQRVIQALCELAGGVYTPLPVDDGVLSDVAQAALKASADFGDVMRSLQDAVSDSRITGRERDGVHAKGAKVIETVALLMRSVDQAVAAPATLKVAK